MASLLCGKYCNLSVLQNLKIFTISSVSAIAWGLVFGLGFLGVVKAMLLMVLVDFVLVGSFVATFLWFFTNRFLNQNNAITQTNDQKVEWAYAFDVHCNSFFPLFLILYIIQFFFLNLLVRHNWASLIISNSIYLVSVIWYCYGTFLGFNGKYIVCILSDVFY